MRVLFVLPTLSNGGAEKVATILSGELSKTNIVEIFTLESIDINSYAVNDRVKVKSAGFEVLRSGKLMAVCSFLKTFFLQKKALANEIREYSPDVVISFLPKADFLVASLKRMSKDFVWISSERNDPTQRNSIERIVLTNIYKKTDWFVCQTNKVAEYYKNKGVVKTTVIYNPFVPIFETNYSFPSELNKEKKYIISVGRLDKQKNYEMLIKAFSLVDNRDNYDLIILGTGFMYQKLQQLIVSLNQSDNIHLLGRKNNVADYLRASDFFVLSSDYEGMPNALIEAMSIGLPVISTDFFTGAAQELVEDGGLLVHVGNENEMTLAIRSMIDREKNEKERMGKENQKKIELMDSTYICKKWEELFEVKKECHIR